MSAPQDSRQSIAVAGSRRTFIKGAAAVAGAAVAAGIGHAITSRPPAVRTQRLEPHGTLSGFAYDPHLAAFHRMASLFKHETGSTITVQPQPAPGATQLLSALSAGTQPDIACVLGLNTPVLAVRKAIIPLDTSVYKANHIVVARDFAGDVVARISGTGARISTVCPWKPMAAWVTWSTCRWTMSRGWAWTTRILPRTASSTLIAMINSSGWPSSWNSRRMMAQSAGGASLARAGMISAIWVSC